jgi:hypothetical protein
LLISSTGLEESYKNNQHSIPDVQVKEIAEHAAPKTYGKSVDPYLTIH